MEKYNLNNFTRGWICGDFDPAIVNTKNYEVGIKYYKSGDVEERHYHLEADEITTIIFGEVEMNGSKFSTNDIILIKKGESTNFKCLKDACTVVVKTKSVKNDKYFGNYSSPIIEIDTDGTKRYYNENKQLHRLDGPAIDGNRGIRFWYKNGQLHRKNGPAIDCDLGIRQWHIEGKNYTEEEFNKITSEKE